MTLFLRSILLSVLILCKLYVGASEVKNKNTYFKPYTYEQGVKFLDYIREYYPDLLVHLDKFRQNDSIGNPIVFNYGTIGFFSPTTLYYIKTAGDLRKEFGDLSKKHIVEIGGGYGGQCKILNDLGGFASYTLVDSAEANALSQKVLSHFGIQNVRYVDQLPLDQNTDILIWHSTFYHFDSIELDSTLVQVIKNIPCGYLMTSHTLSSEDEIIIDMLKLGRKGRIKSATPLIHRDCRMLIWKPKDYQEQSIVRNNLPRLKKSSKFQEKIAVTYGLSGGRFGDNLLAYCRGKWIATKYGIPFLYKPFPFSDTLCLSDRDQPLSGKFSFKRSIPLSSQRQMNLNALSTLYVVPYCSDFREEVNMLADFNLYYFEINWDDPIFNEEIRQCLAPKINVPTLPLPQGVRTVAIHVRTEGAEVVELRKGYPLKSPPDSYYVSQLQRIAKIFEGEPLYIYLFTDDPHPEAIAMRLSEKITTSNITFHCGWKSEGDQMLSDFYSMSKFDCLIHSASNFSVMAACLGDYTIKICPTHCIFKNNETMIDQVDIKFKSKN